MTLSQRGVLFVLVGLHLAACSRAWVLCRPLSQALEQGNGNPCPTVDGETALLFELSGQKICSRRGCDLVEKNTRLRCAGRYYTNKDLMAFGECNKGPGDETSAPTPPPSSNPVPGPNKTPKPTPQAFSDDVHTCHGDRVDLPEEWSGLLIATFVFSLLAIIIGFLGVGFLVKYWKEAVVKMSQRVILLLLCCGVITLNLGMLLLVSGQGSPSSQLCMSAFALIELSLTLLIACISVKEWRAWKVRFNSLKFQRANITDKFVYGIIAVCVLVTLLFIIVNFVTDPPTPDACQEYFCTTGTWFYVFWSYLMILNIIAIVLAIMTRDVPSVAGESSSILHVSLFTLFSMVIVTIAFLVESLGSELKLFLLGFVLFWVSVCYMALIVFRKYAWVGYSAEDIRALFLGDKQDSKMYQAAAARTCNDNGSTSANSTSSSSTNPSFDRTALKGDLSSPQPQEDQSLTSIPIHSVDESKSDVESAVVPAALLRAQEKRKTGYFIATAQG